MRRRAFLTAATAAVAAAGLAPRLARAAAPAGLTSMTGAARPIDRAERLARIGKLQRLMSQQGVGAMILESGSSLEYFTGVQWRRSERTTAAVIPARGETVLVTPAFEEPSVRETLAVPADVRPWNEHESPFAALAGALRDRGAGAGKIAFEDTTRLYIVDGVRAAAPALSVVSGTALVRACRLIKSPAELALMQTANDVTLAALRHVHANAHPGMSPGDIGALMNAATVALGGSPEFALVLINEASAYPHGSKQPQTLHEGSVILMDVGCTVHGYQSDISRTWVMGQPTPKQRKVWDTVKRGQEIALATARPGVAVGTIDDAVRAYYEKEGWGPGYKLPGLSHRTGHGIGLDGHEPPYLVHADATPLEPGMCFSDEPGIYIPGEFGVRLEDCWRMTEAGPKLFTPLAKSIDDPI
ncbi:MAG TPA: Xaa-Pro peptidase family protein [Phenylobacterium sp.]|jgi:Xaa-Pro dipeptidase|uniref:M24 family metallopeptidase n=1 Tax=Phenylobacterium sp. TaxID=1871053 RepID=UPI002C302C36|nr:Xaa-Pro peptidase family protein [Phenylobacterium sp.]HXA41231.1 Xaa-Pro peptidase family protein [Phenylobacterium sp.]